jgi:histidine ammonia-lyase
MTITLNCRADLTLEAARRIAWDGEGVVLGAASQQAITQARARFMRLIDDPEITIYGVTSGYGQNARVRLTPEQRMVHADRPPVPAAAAWGDPVPDRVARAIVFARLANFVEGHAGVSPAIANGVAAMLDGGPLPKVPARGQGGAGEILSLSHLFLPLARSMQLGEKDALSLINGSPSATGLVVDGALAAAALLDVAAEVLALAAEAFNTPLGHFDPELDTYWNNPHDAWALTRLRDLIDGGHGGDRRPYQAPVSFRILPRVLGQAHLAAETARNLAEQSLPAMSDNPALLPPDADNPNGRAVSTGGYHSAQVPMVLDMLTASYANLCVLAGRLSAKMMDGAISLLPPQLGVAEGHAYVGCLPMAITGYEEEARMLARIRRLRPERRRLAGVPGLDQAGPRRAAAGERTGGAGANSVDGPRYHRPTGAEPAGVIGGGDPDPCAGGSAGPNAGPGVRGTGCVAAGAGVWGVNATERPVIGGGLYVLTREHIPNKLKYNRNIKKGFMVRKILISPRNLKTLRPTRQSAPAKPDNAKSYRGSAAG